MRARAQLKSTRGGECESRLSITRLLPNAAEAQPRNIKHEHLIDLPVQAPTKYELVINLKTAKPLGLEVPPTLLARADEVIE